MKDNPDLRKYIDFQNTPTLLPPAAGGHLVVCDPFGKVIALEPATGTPRWTMDPKINKTPYAGRFKCRGVEYWADDTAAPDAACAHRLFLATADKRLIAMDARDGRRCAGFGVNGEVNVDTLIKATFPADGVQLTQLASPPTAINGVVAVSSFANKFRSSSSVNGAIRGFDARTGALRWTFDPLVRDAATGFEPTPIEVGGGNTWVPMSADSERDLLFIPTAAPAPNYWGAHRPGDNRYANSISRPARHDGRGGLALPDPAPRRVGPGRGLAAHPRGHPQGRPHDSLGDPAGEDRHGVRLRTGDR